MKQILIIILLALFSISVNADEKIYFCKHESGVESLTAITPSEFTIWYQAKGEKSAKHIQQKDRYIAEFDDRKIMFFKKTSVLVYTRKLNDNSSYAKCTKLN